MNPKNGAAKWAKCYKKSRLQRLLLKIYLAASGAASGLVFGSSLPW